MGNFRAYLAEQTGANPNVGGINPQSSRPVLAFVAFAGRQMTIRPQSGQGNATIPLTPAQFQELQVQYKNLNNMQTQGQQTGQVQAQAAQMQSLSAGQGAQTGMR